MAEQAQPKGLDGKAKAGAFLAAGTIDALLASAGIPGVASPLTAAGLELFERRAREAESIAIGILAQRQAELSTLSDRVRACEITQDELDGRLTLFMRQVHEAGRHPDAEIRRALGTLAARLLLEDEDSIEAFELAEVLPTLTAADLATLRAIFLLDSNSRQVAVKEQALKFRRKKPDQGVGNPNHVCLFMRHYGFGDYSETRVQHVVDRLTSKHLTIDGKRKSNAGRPHRFGLRLLELIGRDHEGSVKPDWPTV